MSEVAEETPHQPIKNEPNQPITEPPGEVKNAPIEGQLTDESQEAVNWWSGWGSSATKWSKTLTGREIFKNQFLSMNHLDVSSNVTKSVSYGLELANQVLDKEIEIEIDVDKVTNQVSTLAAKTVEESKVKKSCKILIINF